MRGVIQAVGRDVASLLCMGCLLSCTVDLPRKITPPTADAHAPADSQSSLDARIATEAGTHTPDGGDPMDASVNRPAAPGAPPCNEEDTCSTVCDWVVQCISDVRTCARPNSAWSQQVSEVCDAACVEAGPGLARFYRNTLCNLSDCDDLAEVNLRVDAERIIMEPELWAQYCAETPAGSDGGSPNLDAGPPDQGGPPPPDAGPPDQGGPPPPPGAPPCSEERTCEDLCGWMQACSWDERTCANPDPERTQELAVLCQQLCEQDSGEVFVGLLCEQADCADVRNIEVLDALTSGAWSNLWQHCSPPPPD